MAFAFTTSSTSLCKSASARQQGSLRACFATRPAGSGLPVLQKQSLHQAAPSFAPVRRISHTVCMAEQNAGQQLDKSTPDSTWKKLLSAQEVSDVCFCTCRHASCAIEALHWYAWGSWCPAEERIKLCLCLMMVAYLLSSHYT